MARRLSDVGVLVLVLLSAAVLSGQQAGSPEARIDFTAKGVTQMYAFESIVKRASLKVVGTFRGDEHYRYDFALSDVTLADNMKTYRQQLRDLTSGLDTVDKVNNVTWPTKPS